MKIAIVGSGVSGLVAAHRLHPRHEITVFEADSRIGGHVSTVELEASGSSFSIDTGFIVYNEHTYPHFVSLLDELGVETQPTEMSFGISCDRTGIEWASRGLGAVFAQPRNLIRPSFLRMLRDILRFNRESTALLEHADEKVTLGDYLCGGGYSSEFVDHYVVPMGAAIWSADPAAFLRFPAASFVRFFENHGLLEARPKLPWRVISGGSQRYVDELIRPFSDRIRTQTPVFAIRRQRRFVEVATKDGTERFDRVVLATHSDQALRLLSDPSGQERALLRAIEYQENDVVLHTDASLMPRSKRAYASWNYRIPHDRQSRALVTYDMNRLQGIESPIRFFVTLNDRDRIDPRHVIRRFTYQHPVFDQEAISAQKKRGQISGAQRTHYCGAYWGYGFHEDGVRSAIDVCNEIDSLSTNGGGERVGVAR